MLIVHEFVGRVEQIAAKVRLWPIKPTPLPPRRATALTAVCEKPPTAYSASLRRKCISRGSWSTSIHCDRCSVHGPMLTFLWRGR